MKQMINTVVTDMLTALYQPFMFAVVLAVDVYKRQTVYNKITYNVIDDTSWYGAHVKFVCTSSDKNDVIDIEF